MTKSGKPAEDTPKRMAAFLKGRVEIKVGESWRYIEKSDKAGLNQAVTDAIAVAKRPKKVRHDKKPGGNSSENDK